MNKSIKIANRVISAETPAFIVAEISGNHNGDYHRAVDIIHAAKEAGVDAVKLQTYTADTITLDCDNEHFKLNHGTIWDGTTLHNLYREAYTPWEWQPKLKEEAEKCGLICFSSPFDFTAVDFLTELDMPAYKIASFEINDIPLIRKAARTMKPIILATGIASPEDLSLALKACYDEGNKDVVILKCVSAYPASFEDIHLRTIPTLATDYDCLIGLSDHSPGATVAVGAICFGAVMIEKHLTLSRADGGPDSAFSMEPHEFASMVSQIRDLEKALGRSDYALTTKQIQERESSKYLSRSLFAVCDIKAGETFTPANIRSIRPGIGLAPRYYEEVLGKNATCDIKRGTPLNLDMIGAMP